MEEPTAGPDLDPWYVTGLVEAGGSFTFSRGSRAGVRGKRSNMVLYFAVRLLPAEESLLESLQRYFGGIGTAYRVRPRPEFHPAGFAQAASYYRVCRRAELARIVEHFDAYPLKGARAAAFGIWRLMVLLKLEFPRTSGNELEVLAKKLSAASPRRRSGSSVNAGFSQPV
jgi:LAGLIDADG DNA endonuclease family protein